jgi:ABC-type branched-subunit amino acid transport system substrate-binding protein
MSAAPPGTSRRSVRVGACLSLTGRYGRFGTQAALGLEAWRSLDGCAELVIEDDQSSPSRLEDALPRVARQCDVLLGPYSTQLMRTAGRVAADAGWLLWNHGGSGDDVEAAYPGHIVSVLTPASLYARPFLRHLAARRDDVRLWIAHGKGSFGQQVAVGAEAAARRTGIEAARISPGELPLDPPARWALLCAGTFEEDIQTVKRARSLPRPPEILCSVAAGVHEFGKAVGDAEGTFGMGQWFPGVSGAPDLGPAEGAFLAAYAALSPAPPDYPAVQAAAGAVLAAHCARSVGGRSRDLLWSAALSLSARTLFGGFRIDPDGIQVGHETALVRWTACGLVTVPA